MAPRVTIFTPVYNDGKYVEDFLPSALGQTFSDIEVLVLENGSNDRSRDTIHSFSDPRLRILHAHVNYRSETAVSVISDIESEYISLLFADDIFLPNKIERSIEALESSGAAVCFSNNLFMDDDGRPIANERVPVSQFPGDITSMSPHEHLYHFLYKGNSLHPVSMVIRRDAYHRLGGLRGFMHQVGDMEFFARALLREKVIFIKEPLQYIRLRTRGRNESFYDDRTIAKIRGERLNFLQNYRSREGLDQLERIFLPSCRGVAVPENMRLWFLGQRFVDSYEPDYRFFGMTCLYDAMAMFDKEISSTITSALGEPPGAYLDRLSSRLFADYGQREDGKAERIAALQQRLQAVQDELRLEREEQQQRRKHLGGAPYKLGTIIDLSTLDADPYVLGGFSQPEPFGRWTDGLRAKISLTHKPTDGELLLTLTPTRTYRALMEIEVTVNQGQVKTFSVNATMEPIALRLGRSELRADGDMEIGIHICDPKRQEEPPSDDRRALGIGLGSIKLERL